MQNFIVLGYVPDTHIQLTFANWLICFIAFFALAVLLFTWRAVWHSVASLFSRHNVQQQLDQLAI